MFDEPKMVIVVAGAAGGVIVAAFNALIGWWGTMRQRTRRRRYLALRIAHQLETYAIQCNDIVANFLNSIEPPVLEYPPPIESDGYELLDHGVVDRYFQFSEQPVRENRNVHLFAEHPSDPDPDLVDQAFNNATCRIRDAATLLAHDLRRRSGLRHRVMDWQPSSKSKRA